MSVVNKRPVAVAIDIGSNSIKMTVARPGDDGGIEEIDAAAEVVRLGQGLDETGRLNEDRMEAAIAALQRFEARARELQASVIMAVATEATRAAENGSQFLERVAQETGLDVRVIDGSEEAQLTFRGLAAEKDLAGELVVADIGGGSTELIDAHDGVVRSARSIPIGSSRLTDRFVHHDPPTEDELATCEAEADRTIRDATAEPLARGENARLIVVGGTGEYLARVVPDENAIDLDAVRVALTTMQTMTASTLAEAIGAPEARARVLPAGAAIVAALASMVNPERIEISRGGVRAGLLVELFRGKVQPAPLEKTDFRDAMRRLIAKRWDAVWEAIPAALDGDDIEGVHDVRVASRRLRAAMDTAAPVFPQKWYRSLHKEAKAITRALGDVRDRDVLIEALRADRAAAPLPEHPGIDRLIARLERERQAYRVEMERYLQQLLEGPVAKEVERRFRAGGAARNGREQAEAGQR